MNTTTKSRHGPRFLPFAALAALVLAAFTAPGCGLFGPERFIVRVDSITGPDTVSGTETLTVRFWGLIGTDGCSDLDRVDRDRTPDTLTLRFHGERSRDRGTDCLFAPVFLEHDEHVSPPLSDPFTVRAQQPDGTFLEKVVRVR